MFIPKTIVEFDLTTSPGQTFFLGRCCDDCVLIRRGVMFWMTGSVIDSSSDDSVIDDLNERIIG